MIEAIGQILGNAIGVTVSPMPEIAIVLILFSRSAVRNSLAFVTGWLLGLTGVGALTLALGLGSNADSNTGGVIQVLIGILFIALALRKWRSRPGEGEQPVMPPWMERVEGASAPRAFGLALVLVVLNPKNLGLTIAAAISISAAGLGSGQESAVLMVFVGLASLTVVAPVTYFFLARERARPTLESIKAWLIRNNDTLMMLLFLLIGAKVLGDGLAGLG